MNKNLKKENIDFLFNCILALETEEECENFFDDLCTIKELQSISQRLSVAKMLKEGCVYNEIVEATNASTATISRVNRSLQYGADGYDVVFKRLGIED